MSESRSCNIQRLVVYRVRSRDCGERTSFTTEGIQTPLPFSLALSTLPYGKTRFIFIQAAARNAGCAPQVGRGRIAKRKLATRARFAECTQGRRQAPPSDHLQSVLPSALSEV